VTPRVVTLIPWRGGDERREWCWDVTRPSLEVLGFPIFTGDAPGPWARAHAVNAAARTAGSWDVALIGDCDTIPDAASIRRAIAWVLDTRGGARPHAERWMTTKEGALVLAQRGPRGLNHDTSRSARPRHIGRMFAGGGLLVVHRDAWETVGGYDESFVGWGYEDSAMTLALLTQTAWHRLPGEAWHLWHSGEGNKPRPESVRRYKALLAQHADAIARWAGNQGLREPEAVL